ncbi:zinc ABC transporter substrate-binding protein [Oscillatoria sp. FACHB-1407]|uniref:metal ABC transporter solute-binding protein, Zn/Mn family n=1 Tax=Oscillatoria sp. FACHB-1407 TaxID=2692847 RepID=UPI00168455EC|nr:zinc ABC transporter substrate-binding protein [Oscillatoria sp. FACHB-1407]MBD2461448.1 zinc ABC transporter substrate-binding protein [Oscillatoria sp. FACHB-1407]
MVHLKTGVHSSSRPVRRLSVLLASAIALGLGSCAADTSTSTSESPQAETSPIETAELQVVTTFLPITQFTKAVAGDRAEVTQLLPTNVGPHDYQATPEDVQRLAQADVLVQNGLEMELFLEDLVDNAGNPDLQMVDSSEGIATIATEDVEGHAHENEDHGHDHANEAEHTDGAEHAEAGHQHGEFNPHVWLDPKRAIEQVENIRDGLIAADPEGEAVYTANAATYIQQLKELDSEITAMLQPYAGKTFVAFHDFAPYFAESYGLDAEFLVDVPDENPSPDDVKRISDEVKESSLKTILTEPQAGEESLAALAEDLNVTVSIFDPMETGDAEAIEPEYYLTVMRQNAQSLIAAFSGSPE